MLRARYKMRSENLLVEALDNNLIFRWFFDFNLLESVWDNSHFTKNRDKLLSHRVAKVRFARMAALPRELGIQPALPHPPLKGPQLARSTTFRFPQRGWGTAIVVLRPGR